MLLPLWTKLLLLPLPLQWTTSLLLQTAACRRCRCIFPGAALLHHFSEPPTPAPCVGIPGMLHRISAIRGRDGRVLGLTYRIGRHVSGAWQPQAAGGRVCSR